MKVVVNGESRNLREGATVADLVRELILEGRPIAVELNRQVVPRGEFPGQPLADGDRVEVIHIVGGG